MVDTIATHVFNAATYVIMKYLLSCLYLNYYFYIILDYY